MFNTGMWNLLRVTSGLVIASVAASQWDIVTFGAVPNVNTSMQAKLNGAALAAAIARANSNSSASINRTVLVPAGQNFWIIPAVPSYTVSAITIDIQGNLSCYTTNFTTHWPGANTSAYDLFSFIDSTGVTIQGSGVVDGSGYDWWWYVILTGKDHRPNLLTSDGVNSDVTVRGLTFRNSPNYHVFLMGVEVCSMRGRSSQCVMFTAWGHPSACVRPAEAPRRRRDGVGGRGGAGRHAGPRGATPVQPHDCGRRGTACPHPYGRCARLVGGPLSGRGAPVGRVGSDCRGGHPDLPAQHW